MTQTEKKAKAKELNMSLPEFEAHLLANSEEDSDNSNVTTRTQRIADMPDLKLIGDEVEDIRRVYKDIPYDPRQSKKASEMIRKGIKTYCVYSYNNVQFSVNDAKFNSLFDTDNLFSCILVPVEREDNSELSYETKRPLSYEKHFRLKKLEQMDLVFENRASFHSQQSGFGRNAGLSGDNRDLEQIMNESTGLGN